MAQPLAPFKIMEATIDDIHSAYKSGHLTCRQLVQMYLDRIESFDQKGPAINAIISLNSTALQEADRLDVAFKASGLVGPLHAAVRWVGRSNRRTAGPRPTPGVKAAGSAFGERGRGNARRRPAVDSGQARSHR